MKLLMACWRTAGARCVPVALPLMAVEFVDGGFGRDSVALVLVGRPSIWAVLALGWAAIGARLLRRRAAAAGITLSVAVLDDRQKHVLRPVRGSEGWQERVRGELLASERSFLVAEKSREEVHFRWRPGRKDQSVWGSMTFDEPSGDVVLDVRDGEEFPGVAALGKGTAFTAVCQIAGATGLEAAPLAEEHPRNTSGGPAEQR
ncbi:hypothetical protein ACFVU0_05985 [Streptomyces sp. NPDC058122]|uniref:hypothetical protein n=1 Tax=Streptomyces sp. NPDC058122 TaxID=3346349 RepID=UPI0036EE0421